MHTPVSIVPGASMFGICMLNESRVDLRVKKRHTASSQEEEEEEREKKRSLAFSLIRRSNTSPPFVWFHSFVSSFCFVPFHVCLSIFLSPLFFCPAFLSVLALHHVPPSHCSLSFPSILTSPSLHSVVEVGSGHCSGSTVS